MTVSNTSGMACATVEEYLDSLPPERREVVSNLRDAVLANLNPGFEEGIQYGAIGYYVPHSVYPPGYHCDPKQPVPFMGIANQKHHVGLYAFCIYCSQETMEWFVSEHAKTGWKLDMGKGCIRFRKMDQVPYELVGRLTKRVTVEDFLGAYLPQVPTKRR